MPAKSRTALPLRQTQRWFFQAIAPSATISASAKKRSLAGRVLEGMLVPPRTGSARDALAIHGRMYLLRFEEALVETFPAVAAYKGEAKFRAFVAEYAKLYPSRHPSLRYLGQHVPLLLRKGRLAEGEVISDLARLEWARMDAFDAPDEQSIMLSEMQSRTPEALALMNFRLAKSHRLLRLRHDVLPLWKALVSQADEKKRIRPGLPPRQLTAVAVWRKGHAVLHRSVDATEARLLSLLARGATLDGLAAALSRSVAPSELAATVHGLLGRLIDEGVIVV